MDKELDNSFRSASHVPKSRPGLNLGSGRYLESDQNLITLEHGEQPNNDRNLIKMGSQFATPIMTLRDDEIDDIISKNLNYSLDVEPRLRRLWTKNYDEDKEANKTFEPRLRRYWTKNYDEDKEANKSQIQNQNPIFQKLENNRRDYLNTEETERKDLLNMVSEVRGPKEENFNEASFHSEKDSSSNNYKEYKKELQMVNRPMQLLSDVGLDIARGKFNSKQVQKKLNGFSKVQNV